MLLYKLYKSELNQRDRSRLENKTKKRLVIITGYCTYRDVASLLLYQWREDFSSDDFIGNFYSSRFTHSRGSLSFFINE